LYMVVMKCVLMWKIYYDGVAVAVADNDDT